MRVSDLRELLSQYPADMELGDVLVRNEREVRYISDSGKARYITAWETTALESLT